MLIKWMRYTKMKLPRTMEINLSLISFLLPPPNLSHWEWSLLFWLPLYMVRECPVYSWDLKRFCSWWCSVTDFLFDLELLRLHTAPAQDQYGSFSIAQQQHWKKSNCSVMGVTELLCQVVVDLVVKFGSSAEKQKSRIVKWLCLFISLIYFKLTECAVVLCLRSICCMYKWPYMFVVLHQFLSNTQTICWCRLP